MAKNACDACGCSVEQCECAENGTKKRFVVRRNCEYSTTVEAASLEEAVKIANEKSSTMRGMLDWDTAWSEVEVEAE